MSAVREKTKEELFDDLVVALSELEALRAKVAYLESALEDTENDRDRALSAFNELDGKWDAIPWEAIEIGRAVLAWGFRQVRHDELAALTKFIDANAPEEPQND